jgi:hypothetical protein
MEYFEDCVILQLIYENHRILLDFFDRVQIDEIPHQTRKRKLRRKFQERNSILCF